MRHCEIAEGLFIYGAVIGAPLKYSPINNESTNEVVAIMPIHLYAEWRILLDMKQRGSSDTLVKNLKNTKKNGKTPRRINKKLKSIKQQMTHNLKVKKHKTTNFNNILQEFKVRTLCKTTKLLLLFVFPAHEIL